MKRWWWMWAAIIAPGCLLILVGVYFLPPVHSRLGWRLENLRTQVFYLIHPPDQTDFTVEVESRPVEVVRALNSTTTSTPAPGGNPTATPRGEGTSTPAPLSSSPRSSPTPFGGGPRSSPTPFGSGPRSSPTPALTLTPRALPGKVALQGIRYEWQSFNNCGPTNLAMALSYWGWKGDQRTTKAALRPNDDDANVMPEEMAAYAQSTGLVKAMLRYGGDLNLLKQLTAAGYPVLLEIGDQPGKDWWMGHYLLVSGFDEAAQALIAQDSLVMQNLPVPYKEVQAHWWRDFNNLYIVLYPPEREGEVMAMLGADADPVANRRRALQKAVEEAPGLSGRDLFFDLFNQGDDLLALGDASGAAQAFDAAFGMYKSIDEKSRPWRVMWYRVGPYVAYYQTGQYGKLIGLANGVLGNLSKRGLEESHYWRGMAYEATGERELALEDYQIALMLRPGYAEAAAGVARVK